jgi:hypothetical protein
LPACSEEILKGLPQLAHSKRRNGAAGADAGAIGAAVWTKVPQRLHEKLRPASLSLNRYFFPQEGQSTVIGMTATPI